MKSGWVKRIFESNAARLIFNLLLLYVCYLICRLVYLWENWEIFSDGMNPALFWKIFLGGLKFDTSAIFYTNIPLILLFLLPLNYARIKGYNLALRIIYVVVNGFCFLLNLSDSAFFEYRKIRISAATFREFSNENNLGGIIGIETVNHWYFVILLILMVWALWGFFIAPERGRLRRGKFIALQIGYIIFFGAIAVMGMRGSSFFVATRPISVNTAHQYVEDATQTALVLNTPFSIIRTLKEMPQEVPQYYTDESEMLAIYDPVHRPDSASTFKNKNVVVIIVESLSQEFIGKLNEGRKIEGFRSYTPFLDSLLTQSTYFEHSFSNTGFSIDGPPAILSSVPRMGRPFVVSPYSLDHLSSLAGELGKKGYSSAFFHGADNESLGFNAFVKSVGVKEYYGMQEFYADGRFGGKENFDGHWGIWDEPFLQYFAAKLGEMKQPFVASIFTLSSHHPFKVPDKYKDRYPEEGAQPINKVIRYTDYSLKEFFRTAEKQPWYYNTLFIITADHPSPKRNYAEYKNQAGDLMVPIIFFDPSGTLEKGRREGIAQQIDIMPTVLAYLGYDKPFVAFGQNLFAVAPQDTWAMNWVDGDPQFIKGNYIMRSDLEKVTHLYNYVEDPLLKNNLAGKYPGQKEMEREFQAILQTIITRMKENRLEDTSK